MRTDPFIRLASTPPESIPNGLKVLVESKTRLALETPAAQRMAYSMAPQSGGYAINRYEYAGMVETDEFPHKGYWVLMNNGFPTKTVRV